MVLLDFIHAFAETIANEPQCGAQPPRVFYVGGTVRDMLRGEEELRDYDIEVYGVPAERVYRIITTLANRDIEPFGITFGIYKLTFDDGIVDIAMPRTESKHGTGHRGFTLVGDPHLSFTEALARRDFTMNAMLRDVITGEVIDLFHGQTDLMHGVLRVVCAEHFVEDPLRVFRGMQFVARFALCVDADTLALLRRMAASPEIASLSHERITEEWKKMLLAPFPEKGLRFLEDTHLLAQYSELDALRTCTQEPDWHPEGSVWEHTLACIEVGKDMVQDYDSVERITVLLALLLHDAGKMSWNAHRVQTDHAAHGVALAQIFFKRFTFAETLCDDVCTLIAFHEALPGLYAQVHYEHWSEPRAANALRMLMRDVGAARMPLLYAVCAANARGRGLPLDDRPYPVQVWAQDLARRYGLERSAYMPLLSGTDVQNIATRLHATLPKGKEFGIMLASIESARDRGEISTRNEAIAYVEKILTVVG